MSKKIIRKKCNQKKFEWLKMSYIFINPYPIHFRVDFSFYFLNMCIKEFFRIIILHMGFLVH